MKHLPLLLAMFVAVFASTASALPPVQHRVDGVVQAIDRDKAVVTLGPNKDDQPTTFAIRSARTRFRQDGKPSSFEQLPVGATVRIYFRQEVGVSVATEISWKSPSAVAPPKNTPGQ